MAVNMHPHFRLPFSDWLQKIAPFVDASDKFEKEDIVDEFMMLPGFWRKQPFAFRKKWIKIIDDANANWDVELISKLRSAGMGLQIVASMFKIYKAVKRIDAKSKSVSTPPPVTTTPPPIARNKSKMIYHLFNAQVDGMSPLDRFRHAVTVRNRTFGPDKGTTVSPHLDIEVTRDNVRMLRLKPLDVNMHRVLQESTCRAGGKRRRVARRILNALGGVSGYAQSLNDPDQVRELRQNIKFAETIESIKHAERDLKYRKAKEKRDKAYAAAFKKMGLELSRDTVVYKKHVQRNKLTIAQMKAVAFVDCTQNLTGNAADVRRQLLDLLPKCPDPDTEEDEDLDETTPEFETQSVTANISIDVPLEEMNVGDMVEVYWKGDRVWYEGEITNVDLGTKQFEINYFLDNKTLTHNDADYKVRMSC